MTVKEINAAGGNIDLLLTKLFLALKSGEMSLTRLRKIEKLAGDLKVVCEEVETLADSKIAEHFAAQAFKRDASLKETLAKLAERIRTEPISENVVNALAYPVPFDYVAWVDGEEDTVGPLGATALGKTSDQARTKLIAEIKERLEQEGK
jgi:hypothetical protein